MDLDLHLDEKEEVLLDATEQAYDKLMARLVGRIVAQQGQFVMGEVTQIIQALALARISGQLKTISRNLGKLGKTVAAGKHPND